MRASTRIVVALSACWFAFTSISTPRQASAMSHEVLFSILGQPHDQVGAVGGAGDFNGDGIPDVIVGATQHVGGFVGTGVAYVVFCGPAATGTPDLVLRGQRAGEYFGNAVTGIGDVNDDGYDDLAVAARGPHIRTGRVYVYFGGAPPDSIADVVMAETPEGSVWSGFAFGHAIARAGDVNDDGVDDLIVGWPSRNQDLGAACIYFGGANFDSVADVVLAPTNGAGSCVGWSVAGLGDVNGDGIDDLAIGTQHSGGMIYPPQAYIYFGGEALLAQTPANIRAPSSDHASSVTGVEDMSGDGIRDVAVGWMEYGASTPTGSMSLYFGGAQMDTAADRVFVTEDPFNDRYGMAVDGADIDGDGFGDVFVSASAHGSPVSNYLGRVYVYRGGPDGDSVPDAIFTGDDPHEGMGGNLYLAPKAIARVGDLNGDGTDEIVIGSTNDPAGGPDAGSAEVIAFYPNVASVVDGTNQHRLEAWPVPYRGGVLRAQFVAAGAAATRLDIFDIHGRRLRTLAQRTFSAGAQEVAWDGRGEDGVPVRSGVYILRVSGDGREQRLRLPVVR